MSWSWYIYDNNHNIYLYRQIDKLCMSCTNDNIYIHTHTHIYIYIYISSLSPYNDVSE